MKGTEQPGVDFADEAMLADLPWRVLEDGHAGYVLTRKGSVVLRFPWETWEHREDRVQLRVDWLWRARNLVKDQNSVARAVETTGKGGAVDEVLSFPWRVKEDDEMLRVESAAGITIYGKDLSDWGDGDLAVYAGGHATYVRDARRAAAYLVALINMASPVTIWDTMEAQDRFLLLRRMRMQVGLTKVSWDNLSVDERLIIGGEMERNVLAMGRR